MPGARLPRHVRIRRGSEILAVLRRGTRERTGHFDIFRSDAPSSHSRFGVIVPKHRHKIVERNRLKRRIREVGRTELLPMLASSAPTDLLVRARPGAYELTFEQIRDELEQVMTGQVEGSP
jgi:ribonuclease P protein component